MRPPYFIQVDTSEAALDATQPQPSCVGRSNWAVGGWLSVPGRQIAKRLPVCRTPEPASSGIESASSSNMPTVSKIL